MSTSALVLISAVLSVISPVTGAPPFPLFLVGSAFVATGWLIRRHFPMRTGKS